MTNSSNNRTGEPLFHIETKMLYNKYTLRRLPPIPNGFVWVWGTTKTNLQALGLKVHAIHNRHSVWFYQIELIEIEAKLSSDDYDRKSIYGGR